MPTTENQAVTCDWEILIYLYAVDCRPKVNSILFSGVDCNKYHSCP